MSTNEDKARLVIEITASKMAAPGAAAAFLLRSISARAGCYAPGIHENLFFDLQRDHNGKELGSVEKWFLHNMAELQYLGYRILARRVSMETDAVIQWVETGMGFRGAVVPTDGAKIHPQQARRTYHHAVAVSVGANGAGKDQLLYSDPWGPETAAKAPPRLEPAHREHKYQALCFYWSGYS